MISCEEDGIVCCQFNRCLVKRHSSEGLSCRWISFDLHADDGCFSECFCVVELSQEFEMSKEEFGKIKLTVYPYDDFQGQTLLLFREILSVCQEFLDLKNRMNDVFQMSPEKFKLEMVSIFCGLVE